MSAVGEDTDLSDDDVAILVECLREIRYEDQLMAALGVRDDDKTRHAMTFDPAKHPRGQPENRGEFAPKGTVQSSPESKDAPHIGQLIEHGLIEAEASRWPTLTVDNAGRLLDWLNENRNPDVPPMRAQDRNFLLWKSQEIALDETKNFGEAMANGLKKVIAPDKTQSFIEYANSLVEHGLQISQQQAQLYRDTLHKALARFTPSCALRLAENIKGFRFWPDLVSLTARFMPDNSKTNEKPGGEYVGGVFQGGGVNVVNLDGEGLNYFRESRKADPSSPSTLEEVYIHELSHALDPDMKIVHGEEWVKASYDEIVPQHEGDTPPLSAYAASSPEEAWAEFGRLAVTNPDRAKHEFPKCWKVWEDHGLIEG